MAEDKVVSVTQGVDEKGSIKISADVIATIASLAAAEVPGLANMAVGGISGMLGRKNLTKGVKVELGEGEVSLSLFVIVEFGLLIPEVAESVQQKVKSAVESMTGLRVVSVDVHVQGVTFPQGHPSDSLSED